LKGKKWLQMNKLLIEHAKVHNGDSLQGCASDIQIKMVIHCLKEENPTISPHTHTDVVYVFSGFCDFFSDNFQGIETCGFAF
jgi:hypothetical protein